MAKGYKQGNDNGVLQNPKGMKENSKTYKCFSDILGFGENPKGFTAVTPNGISRINDDLVHKDNFGKRENGSHSDFLFDF